MLTLLTTPSRNTPGLAVHTVNAKTHYDVAMDVERQLLELEESLLRPEVRSNRDVVSALLEDEFVEYGSSGRIYDKRLTLEALATSPSASPKGTIVDFHARPLAPGVVLVAYRLVESERGESLRSSVWRLRDDRWRLAFHQGAPRCSLELANPSLDPDEQAIRFGSMFG